MNIERPMLAGKVENFDDVLYPVLGTPKYDGIRCLVVDGRAMTRNFKPIPNKYVRELVEDFCPSGFDGELLVKGKFSQVASAIMSKTGQPAFTYHVFDYVKDSLATPYIRRVKELHRFFLDFPTLGEVANMVMPTILNNADELREYEERCLGAGYEGAIIRSPESPYKQGRSTWREGYMLKVKRFLDDEAIIVGFEGKMSNENVLESDAFGLAKRSTKKEGMKEVETLGAIRVRRPLSSVTFSIGTGFNDAWRQEIWNNQEYYLGKTITFKHQPYGAKDLPRFPVFKNFRDTTDASHPMPSS